MPLFEPESFSPSIFIWILIFCLTYLALLSTCYVAVIFERRQRRKKALAYYVAHAPSDEQRQKTLASISKASLRWVEASEQDAVPWTRRFTRHNGYQEILASDQDRELHDIYGDPNLVLNLRLSGMLALQSTTGGLPIHSMRFPSSGLSHRSSGGAQRPLNDDPGPSTTKAQRARRPSNGDSGPSTAKVLRNQSKADRKSGKEKE